MKKVSDVSIPIPIPILKSLTGCEQAFPDRWVERSVKHMKAEGKSRKTIENYISAIRHFTTAFNKHPKSISNEEIQNYFNQVVKIKKFSPATFNLHVSGIKYFYNTVLGFEDKNPVLIKKRVSCPHFEILSPSELICLFNAEKSLRNRLLLKAGYAFGLRVNRAVSLKRSDFDLNRQLLFIKGEKGKKDRYVLLFQDFRDELVKYIQLYEIEEHLFPGSGPGGCMSCMRANQIFNRAARMAGISKNISFHSLRRSFAAHLCASGYSLRDIQFLLGHSTSRTTKHYRNFFKKPNSNRQITADKMGVAKPQRSCIQHHFKKSPIHILNNTKSTLSSQSVSNEYPIILPYRQYLDYREDRVLAYNHFFK